MLTYTHMKTRTTRSIVSGKDVLSRIPAELARAWPGSRALIVADTHTWKAAGETVSALLADAGYARCAPYIFPGDPHLHGDLERIEELVRFMRTIPSGTPVVPVSVGSGTVNDIVKRAAFEMSLAYVCVPTAPSVDGYTSFGSAITINGFKTTMPCDAPALVVADQDLMANAPYELLAAGYGDLAAKLNSGRDWLIAETLGLETITPSIWALSQEKLVRRLSNPDGLARRDSGAVRDVFDGLCDTGLAMQDQGDSRPASGAEHHVSHCWEMRGLRVNGVDVLHGEKVAAGTLLATAFAEIVFSTDVGEVRRLASSMSPKTPAGREKEVRTLFAGTGIRISAVDDAVRMSLEKLQTGAAFAARLEKICERWETLRALAFRDRPRYAELSDLFLRARCPSFEKIGVDADLARWGLFAAQTIRNRYTVLDLAYELGMLGKAIDAVVTEKCKIGAKAG